MGLKDIENKLEDIGLTGSEIKVYFALLDLGQTTTTAIVRKSGVSNSKVYSILYSLVGKGLVSYISKNGVKHFSASNPENLIEFLDKKEKSIQEQKKEIKEILPEIGKRHNLQEETRAEIYEGYKGVKTAIENILNVLKAGETYYVFVLGDELEKPELINFFQEYHKKRVDKKIRVRLIVPHRLRNLIRKYYRYKYMFVRYTNLNLPTGVFVYKNTVMTIIWDDVPKAFVLYSKNNASKYHKFFNDVWLGKVR